MHQVCQKSIKELGKKAGKKSTKELVKKVCIENLQVIGKKLRNKSSKEIDQKASKKVARN